MSHQYEYIVCYADTDAGGVVYHTKYLEIAERCRSAFFRENGYSQTSINKNLSTILVIRDARGQFKKPARLDDVLNCQTTVIGLKAARVFFRTEIFQDKQLLSIVDVELVSVDSLTFHPHELPPPIREICTSIVPAPTSTQ